MRKKKCMKLMNKLIEPVIRLIGKQIALKRDRQEVFEHYLAVCAIFRDEAFYLEEWLSFHHLMGVSHFYLYNDRSEDDYMTVLTPWIEKGFVTLVDWHAKNQKPAYNHCIKKNKMKARWIAFIDLDEFLFSPLSKDITSVLKQYSDCAAIFVYWVLFGSSGHINKPKEGVIKSYTKCMDFESALNDNFDHQKNSDNMSNYVTGWSQDGKSIINPRLVKEYNVHAPKSFWKGALVNENRVIPKLKNRDKEITLSYSIFRINHYWSKSIQDIVEKVAKGSVCNNKRAKRNLDRWLEREKQLNVAEDTTVFDILNQPSV
jgi:hypothetical protein